MFIVVSLNLQFSLRMNRIFQQNKCGYKVSFLSEWTVLFFTGWRLFGGRIFGSFEFLQVPPRYEEQVSEEGKEMWRLCKITFYLLNCVFLPFHILENGILHSHCYGNLRPTSQYSGNFRYHMKMKEFGMCSGDNSVHSFGILLRRYQYCVLLTVDVWTCRWLRHLWLSATALRSLFLWLFLLASYIISSRYDFYSSLKCK
jgi:hypothetical protein